LLNERAVHWGIIDSGAFGEYKTLTLRTSPLTTNALRKWYDSWARPYLHQNATKCCTREKGSSRVDTHTPSAHAKNTETAGKYVPSHYSDFFESMADFSEANYERGVA
jgi:hypothetical protein